MHRLAHQIRQVLVTELLLCVRCRAEPSQMLAVSEHRHPLEHMHTREYVPPSRQEPGARGSRQGLDGVQGTEISVIFSTPCGLRIPEPPSILLGQTIIQETNATRICRRVNTPHTLMSVHMCVQAPQHSLSPSRASHPIRSLCPQDLNPLLFPHLAC